MMKYLIMASIMSFDFFMVIFFPLGSFLGAVFTLYIFSFTQHGQFFFMSNSKLNCTLKELNVLMMHIISLNLIILVPEMFLLV